jgi:hypothetical protein
MPVASATHAPSRSPSSSMAGCQHSSGMRSTIRRMRSSTGNPKENPTPRLRQAAANRCVGPGRVRACQHPWAGGVTGPRPGILRQLGQGHVQHLHMIGGGVAAPRSQGAAALPAPPRPPPPAGPRTPAAGRSRTSSSRWPGGRRVLFLAMGDADRGIKVNPQLGARLRAGPACHARFLAAARAARTRPRCGSSIRSSSRHAVGIDATRPNSTSRSRSTSIPVTASAPSAITTARFANTCPGVCSGIPR